MLYLKIKWKT